MSLPTIHFLTQSKTRQNITNRHVFKNQSDNVSGQGGTLGGVLDAGEQPRNIQHPKRHDPEKHRQQKGKQKRKRILIFNSTFGIVIENGLHFWDCHSKREQNMCILHKKLATPSENGWAWGFLFGRIRYYGKVSCEFLGEISPRANSWAHGLISQQFCPFVVGTSYPQN